MSMSKLDDIFKNTVYGGSFDTDERKIAWFAKEEVKALMLELIGEDTPGVGKLRLEPNDDTPGMKYGQAQNKLRAELRQKVEEL